MARLHERSIALAADERQTLAALAEHALEPAGERLELAARGGGGCAGTAARIRDVLGEAEALARLFEAAETGVIDVADPVLQAWMCRRRDALLALLRDDRAALYDSLAACRAEAVAPDRDPAIAQRWRLVDEDLEELGLIARLLSDALDATAMGPAAPEASAAARHG
ncbi:MAG TPA: hypothetical protein VNT03_08645 [Baekduia sp.]|nr:hypothetical protein [Baekduia sp.]